MKKLMIALAMILGVATFSTAKDIYAHDASALPKAAQTTIANNFKAKVSLVKIDKDWGRVSEYDAILTDGTEISFDSKGNWENVEVSNTKSVPAAFVPQAILNFIAKQQPGQRIVGIDRDRRGYEVELSNGIDIKFDKAGKFLSYDD